MKRILPVFLILAVAMMPIPVYAETDDSDATHRIFMPAAGMVRPRAFVLSDAQSLARRGYGGLSSQSIRGITIYSYGISDEGTERLSDAERYVLSQGSTRPTVAAAASDINYNFFCAPGQTGAISFYYWGQGAEYTIEWHFLDENSDADWRTQIGWTPSHIGQQTELALMPEGFSLFGARLIYLGPVAFPAWHLCLPSPRSN